MAKKIGCCIVWMRASLMARKFHESVPYSAVAGKKRGAKWLSVWHPDVDPAPRNQPPSLARRCRRKNAMFSWNQPASPEGKLRILPTVTPPPPPPPPPRQMISTRSSSRAVSEQAKNLAHFCLRWTQRASVPPGSGERLLKEMFAARKPHWACLHRPRSRSPGSR